jgi:hypothetical protein
MVENWQDTLLKTSELFEGRVVILGIQIRSV